MAQDIEELLRTLGEEKILEEKLLEVLRTKKDLVVGGRVAELTELMKEEEMVLGRIRLATLKRRKQVMEIRRRLRVSSPTLTVEEIIRLVEEPQRGRLAALRKEIKGIMRELAYLNDLIRILIRQSLTHLNNLVDALSGTGLSPMYSARGRQDRAYGGPALNLVDQVA